MKPARNRGRPGRGLLLVAGAAAVAISAGCGSAHPDGVATATGMRMSTGMHMGQHSSDGTTERPSETARMVCGAEIHRDIAQTFELTALRTGTSTWHDRLFTCTYQLRGGPLTLSVKDSTDEASGTAYFSALRAMHGSPRLLRGLEAFGLPSYQTGDGIVAFLKDGKTLEVDATGLPVAAGPHGESRTDAAYAIAADVIGCWSE